MTKMPKYCLFVLLLVVARVAGRTAMAATRSVVHSRIWKILTLLRNPCLFVKTLMQRAELVGGRQW